jgi:ATP-dependent helicase HrpB
MIRLPIDPHIPAVLSRLESGRNLVLQASPGSGKTTRVPPAILKATQRQVIVLEPRRLAAKWAAKRVADELGGRVGDLVGYQFRFENMTSSRTRLRFLTEGMLMRQMLSNPRLDGVSTVVLDEFHERHLHGDLALSYLRWLQQGQRPDLRIVVMSATLESETLSKYLGECPVVNVEAKLHPVAIEHLRAPPSRPLEQMVKEAVSSRMKESGHILVFLPGMSEIRKCQEALRGIPDSRLIPLHGELSRDEQDEAMNPLQAPSRKIILATNVAETSLTIEGVTTVIDSGLHRVASHSWWSGVPSLKTRPVSQASAIQRAGRAGRTGPGTCLRLYTREDFISRPAFQTPEIRRADLAQTLLELKTLGIRESSSFSWFEAPDSKALDSAENLLIRLGAVKDGTLTENGRRMAELPVHPRLGRMLVESDRQGVLKEGALLAALLSEGEVDSLHALDSLEGLGRMPHPVRSRIERLCDQLLSYFKSDKPSDDPERKKLGFSLLCGYPDRLAKRRGEELLLATGGSARLPKDADLGAAELFIALDLQETQAAGQLKSNLRAHSVCPIEVEWLFDLNPCALEEQEVLEWDSRASRVVGVSRLTHDGLTLSESRLSRPDPLKRARLLSKVALGLDLNALDPGMQIPALVERIRSAPAGTEVADELEIQLSRVKVLGKQLRISQLVPLIESALAEAATVDEVKKVDWAEAVQIYLETLHPGSSARLVQWAPTHFDFPNGKRGRIRYSFHLAPYLEAPLQYFFGVKKPPSIAQGRTPLTLHLLAPNQRALQVTTDLPGFWARVYPELRHQLSRRYPRHSWPEDPTSAAPVRR